MKLFIAVCLVVVFAHDFSRISFFGLALKCNLCITGGFIEHCSPSVQTCPSFAKACGNLKIETGSPGSPTFRSCMRMSSCWVFMRMPNVSISCCRTDLCN